MTLFCSLSLSLCCHCGVPIPPNPANMCVGCLRARVDITEGIPKQLSVSFCKQCERWGRAGGAGAESCAAPAPHTATGRAGR